MRSRIHILQTFLLFLNGFMDVWIFVSYLLWLAIFFVQYRLVPEPLHQSSLLLSTCIVVLISLTDTSINISITSPWLGDQPLASRLDNLRIYTVSDMRLKYSIPQLLDLRKNSSPTYISAIKQLKLQSRPRYIHRSCRRKFVLSQSGDSIPSLWSAERSVARHLRHQNAPLPGVNSVEETTETTWIRPVYMERNIKRGVDFSLLRSLQHITPANIKIELFNTQSLTNKSCLIHSHILDRNIDIMCLTETWHQPGGFFVLNEACPPGYQYLEKARQFGRGGGLAVLHRSDLKLTPLSLPDLLTFECLAFRCKPPCSMTILLIYRPPKQNPAFISEINELLTSLCATSANIVVLGDITFTLTPPPVIQQLIFYSYWTV